MGAHIAVLANPFAGKGRGAHVAAVAIERLRSEGAEVRTYAGASAADTVRLSAQALDEAPSALVVVGGDGTIAGILDVAIRHTIPLVLVPAGTGNDLARALRVPRRDPGAAAVLALHGIPKLIDLGEVHSDLGERLFVSVAALGFDAKVSDRTNRLRWPRGVLRYYLALVIELARLRPMAFRLAIDGGDDREAPGTLIAVGNTQSYGGGMPVCVGAQPDDGMLDVVHVRPLGRLRLIALFPQLLRGSHLGRREVSHRRAHTITVSAPGLVAYADGERVGTGTCTIGIRPAALTMMVPKGDAADAVR